MAVNDHWRWLAKTDISSAHRSWHSMAADSATAANLSGASRIVVTLQPGDVLIIPRGWWHTTFHNGKEPSIAINLWILTRHPMSEMWWRAHQHLHEKYDSKLPKLKALGSGTADGLSKKVKYDTFDRLQVKIKKVVPWLRATFKKEYVNPEEKPLKPASLHLASESSLCIQWEYDDADTVCDAIRNNSVTSSVDSSQIEKAITAKDARTGNQHVWDMIGLDYLRMMGGTEWQSLPEWREKMYNFFAKGMPPIPVDFERFQNMNHILAENIEPRQSNSYTFWGLIGNCDDTQGGGLKRHVLKPKPRCEAASREALALVLGAARCEIKSCPANTK
eukprot:gnl/MRDRNA2_/MRDRNA2_70526_c0_seq1.p1 gnl/MRDRNA2_/MRDRNA2_70526_c0~~gnl/MRDRNA2_/MRDRNA2_70526_c0_seq1.p1  ORF type:complete len:333 (+),score=47.92 gnl/MRDRNA2_/MRDRNA2_70526_c0_seq1:715-1713(+)